MREIDFIPEWYRAGRQRQLNYRRQYIVLGCLFAVMLIGCVALGVSISKGQSFLERTREARATYETIQHRLNQTRQEVHDLLYKERALGMLDPQVRLAAVLAEITHLMPSEIILETFEIKAEALKPEPVLGGKVVLGSNSPKTNSSIPEGQERFRLQLTGLADDAGQVSRLVANHMDSTYFRQISPGLIRNKTVKGRDCIEFEVACYLANYVLAEGQ